VAELCVGSLWLSLFAEPAEIVCGGADSVKRGRVGVAGFAGEVECGIANFVGDHVVWLSLR
jgi:hypothetical protein